MDQVQSTNDIFAHQRQSKMTCSCGKSSGNTQIATENLLSLPVGQDIDAQVRLEFGESNVGDWRCEQCGDIGGGRQEVYLTQVSDYLIIQLKRFELVSGKEQKNNGLVQFPLTDLNLWSAIHPDSRSEDSTFYDCISIVNHTGSSLHSGHYTTYNRRHNSPD